MATSGITTVSYSAEDIIMSALMMVGKVKFDAPSMPRRMEKQSLRQLNMLVKALESSGLYLWKENLVKLTPVKNRSTYLFGGPEFTYVSDYMRTIAAGSSADTTIDINASVSDGDSIEIYLDDGTIHATTVDGTPTSITGGYRVTLTDALDGAVLSGAQVLKYSSYTSTPHRVMMAQRRTRVSDGSSFYDHEISIWTRDDYREMAAKRSKGDPQGVYFDRDLAASKLHVYPEPDGETTEYLLLSVQDKQEIFNSLSDTPDMQDEWYLALVYSLAKMFMDSDPMIQMTDSHRLNIIKGEEKWLNNAKDFDRVAESFEFDIDETEYEVP